MDWRTGLTVLLVLLILLSPLAGPAAATGTEPTPSHLNGPTAPSFNHTPADPESDVLGWEAGYWHNETITVNQSDGINSSELNATVARTMARVETVRQLEFRRTVPVELQSREAYQKQQTNNTTSPELRRFDNAKYEALFLVGEDTDSIQVQNENTGVSVLGFYSPKREAIVLIAENETNLQVKELTLAHELVHALQDQHFNLSRYHAETRDQVNAQDGLIEGDASLVQYRYKQRCQGTGPWNGTCLSPSDSGGDGESLANIGTYFVKFHPYSDGPPFIQSLYNEGGWMAVNAAYEDLPTSSEQVIHPTKYGKDSPSNVTLKDRNTDAWERVRPPSRPDYGEVGEAAITSMLVFPLYDSNGQTRIINPNAWLNRTAGGEISDFDPLNYGNRFASGWDGDRIHVYANADNETAYVWRLVWETPADAKEFLDGYTQVIEYWGGEETEPGLWVIDEAPFADAFHIEIVGDTVTIVNAPTVEALDEVRTGTIATPTPTPTPNPSPTSTLTLSPSPTSSPIPTKTPGQPGFGALSVVLGVIFFVGSRAYRGWG